MIDLEKLSCEEKKAIEELRKRIGNDLPKSKLDDIVIYYVFLKARDFDVSKAENMLRKHLAWRKHFQVETILEDFTPRPFFEKYIKVSQFGLDKYGNMVAYIPLGKMDSKDVLKCVRVNDYLRHWIWHFEEVKESVLKLYQTTSKQVPQLTCIMDLDRLTISNATSKASMDLSTRLVRMLQDNYPESTYTIFIINAPAFYVVIYSVLKTMMSNRLLQKINIYGYSGWKEKLLEIIDADVLPAFLGGNRTDPDGNPLCNSFVRHAGKFAEMFYLPEVERDFTNKYLVKRLTIPTKSKKEISINVTDNGSRIHWEFMIKNKDIGFGLFYRTSESIIEEILPIERYNTNDGVEKGSYKSRLSGNYIIVFDNSYSWMNSKEIEYCLSVVKPVKEK